MIKISNITQSSNDIFFIDSMIILSILFTLFSILFSQKKLFPPLHLTPYALHWQLCCPGYQNGVEEQEQKKSLVVL
jgi:hypothetical protein